jgi:glycosyltransferase involved in cell wall biosynthesis
MQLMEGLRIALVGNFNPPDSGVCYQVEVLLDAFRTEGAEVIPITYVQNRYLRPLNTLRLLIQKRRQYDVICAQGFSYGNWINGAIAILSALAVRRPIAMVYRGGGFAEFVSRYPMLVLPLLRRVDRLIVPSGYLVEQFRQCRLDADIIPNVIEMDAWPYRRRDQLAPRLLWVRHLRAGYNPLMAVDVLQQVQQRYPGAILRMAGDGGMKDEIAAYATERGVQGVELLGHLPLRDLLRHYAECDIFINTTNYDNHPRSVLEAMASGLPVVSTDVGGLPHLIEHRRTGLLGPPSDAETMTRSVCELLERPDLVQALTDAARDMVRSFSWQSSRHKWHEVFHSLAPSAFPRGSQRTTAA